MYTALQVSQSFFICLNSFFSSSQVHWYVFTTIPYCLRREVFGHLSLGLWNGHSVWRAWSGARKAGWPTASKYERGWEQLDETGGLGAVWEQRLLTLWLKQSMNLCWKLIKCSASEQLQQWNPLPSPAYCLQDAPKSAQLASSHEHELPAKLFQQPCRKGKGKKYRKYGTGRRKRRREAEGI